ncbi:hypothetical protein Hanom_Chr12g01146611 [Helianthus anomalus]
MVENITSKNKTWVYPRFVQMMLDHAYPDLERDGKNDLLVLYHMDNESLKQFVTPQNYESWRDWTGIFIAQRKQLR